MRILVGVDGSEAAQRAARHAFGLASRLAESVTLVHVLPPPPVLSEPAVVPNIAELERLRATGARMVVFVWTTFWWLEHYAEFKHHLHSHYRCVREDESVVAFDLSIAG